MRIALRKGIAAARPRRTQEERRRATQQAILEAAIALLVEEGYARFSTITVARRAGVSRGARENYFRTKYDLIAAAWRAALERAEHRSQRLASGIGGSPDPVGRFLTSARSFFLSPDYLAMLELSMAARTDRRLARIFHALFRDYRKRHDEIWIRALQEAGYERRSIERFVELANCLLRGMALTSAWKLPPSFGRAPFDELQKLAPLLLAAPRKVHARSRAGAHGRSET
jgi:AcrR family transcriptional regulator